jgi:hypothetical protein
MPPATPFLAPEEAAMAGIHEVARDFTAMLRAGQFEAAGNRFWASDVTSIEPAALPGGIDATVCGIEAARRKCGARLSAAKFAEIGIDGPFVTGDQFVLFLDMVIVDRASGGATPFSEIALYTVRGGQIAEERYFYE